MAFDWLGMKGEWIAAVRATLLPKVLADERFSNDGDLGSRFGQEIQTWKKAGSFKPIIEVGNELAAAECLLRSMGNRDRLLYEPTMVGTKMKIDFLKLGAAGQRDWIEVKTVAPQWVDDEAGWKRFTEIAQTFPENARLVVAREWAGAAVSGQAIKARWSFIQRTFEIEQRATVIPVADRGPVWLLFCSTGLAWHVDELEDFADFHRIGKPREDDWMRNATIQYMRDANIDFRRSIYGFHFLACKHDEVSAHDFRLNVSGSKFGHRGETGLSRRKRTGYGVDLLVR